MLRSLLAIGWRDNPSWTSINETTSVSGHLKVISVGELALQSKSVCPEKILIGDIFHIYCESYIIYVCFFERIVWVEFHHGLRQHTQHNIEKILVSVTDIFVSCKHRLCHLVIWVMERHSYVFMSTNNTWGHFDTSKLNSMPEPVW